MTAIVVYHEQYGCETGCCGHRVEVVAGTDRFVFDHANSSDPADTRRFAEDAIRKTFGAEHVADLDFANSVIVESNDCT